jgi:hypothetical protein
MAKLRTAREVVGNLAAVFFLLAQVGHLSWRTLLKR